RLDGERHTCLQLAAGVRLAVVKHLRVFMIDASDPVPAILANDRKILTLDELLNRVPDITEPRAGPHDLNAAPHCFTTCFSEPLRMRRDLADAVHATRVAVKSVFDHGDIDVDDVAAL